MAPIQLFIGTTHILGLMATVVLGFSWCIRVFDGHRAKKSIIGLIFAAGGLLSMIDPLHLQEGVQSDARLPLLALSYAFGGLPAAFISTATLLTARILLGGAGAVGGCVAILMAAGLGVVGARVVRRHKVRSLARRALLAATIVVSIVSSLFFIGPAVFVVPLTQILILIAFNVAAAIVFDDFLRHAKRSYAATRVLRFQAETDPLTRLQNRRSFAEQADRLLAEAGYGSVIMFDIDHFKSINDTHGHDVGDRVLCEIARIVQSEIRKGDLVARYGGEEIIVFIPGASAAVAAAIADAVRARIQGHAFEGAEHLRVTLSAGTAHGAEPLLVLTKRADEALYAAKRNGRNRVELAEAA